MPPDFWRNSNETNSAYTFISSAVDWVRRKLRGWIPVIILDVREQDEYDSGHIPGAVLLPVGNIDEDTAAEVIPEKDSAVLVYCRSGNRSKTASSALAELGYTNIYEFGGSTHGPMRQSHRLGNREPKHMYPLQKLHRRYKEYTGHAFGRVPLLIFCRFVLTASQASP